MELIRVEVDLFRKHRNQLKKNSTLVYNLSHFGLQPSSCHNFCSIVENLILKLSKKNKVGRFAKPFEVARYFMAFLILDDQIEKNL